MMTVEKYIEQWNESSPEDGFSREEQLEWLSNDPEGLFTEEFKLEAKKMLEAL